METFNLITDSTWEIIGIISIFYILLKRKDMLKVKLPHITNFITLMVLLFICRISLADMNGSFPAAFDPDFAGLFMVFIEDFAFVAPGLLLHKYLRKSKIVFYTFWILMSVYFAYQHRLYNPYWIGIVSLYPYFIARKWSLKTSLATVAICHVLYDFSTVLTNIFLRG